MKKETEVWLMPLVEKVIESHRQGKWIDENYPKDAWDALIAVGTSCGSSFDDEHSQLVQLLIDEVERVLGQRDLAWATLRKIVEEDEAKEARKEEENDGV